MNFSPYIDLLPTLVAKLPAPFNNFGFLYQVLNYGIHVFFIT